jgi:hypothetical protein
MEDNKTNKQKGYDNLIPFKKGDPNINRSGRPRKPTLLLKEICGYSGSEINETIKTLLAMKQDELKGIIENKDATVLELWIARAISKGIAKGELKSFMDLCNRVVGLPKQQIEGKIESNVIFDYEKLTDDELRSIKEIQRKLDISPKESD